MSGVGSWLPVFAPEKSCRKKNSGLAPQLSVEIAGAFSLEASVANLTNAIGLVEKVIAVA
jgi:hypothetical protein